MCIPHLGGGFLFFKYIIIKQKKKPPVFTGGFIDLISTDIKIHVS